METAGLGAAAGHGWAGWILALLGAAGAVGFAVNFFRARASRSWPGTVGTVVISEFSRTRDQKGGYHESFRLVYDYAVKGRVYQGKDVGIGILIGLNTFSRGASGASDAHARYALGSSCTVRYNPANPKVCCLEPGGEIQAALGFVFSIVLLCVGMAFFF